MIYFKQWHNAASFPSVCFSITDGKDRLPSKSLTFFHSILTKM
ncbi:hypothetical protein CLOSTHATH_05539 [Hungatella hathewayi DSM 13479]|uniref:Uncharacterized protein n=1 Tax=Hungatella hathewayi DSM 13479 TaxID=566550 RepID=D3API6_9FIRM|nr:hypothetical protein CLOSTHATH_05539 [Hungatella hathewayi DSM 13479]